MSSSAGGQPRTVDVPLTAPAPSVSYTLPPGVTFDVEAVYVEISTAGAGGVVTAELTISEQSGVVIAKKTQGATIPAGTTGTATWALRLTDETATTPGGSGIQFDTYPQAGMDLYTETVGGDPSGFPPWYPDVHTRYPGIPAAMYTTEGTFFVVADATSFMVYSESGEIDLYADPDNFGVVRFTAWEWFAQAFQIQITGGDNGVTIQATGVGDLFLQTDPGGNVRMPTLPVVNPGVPGALWNNGGVVNVS